MAPPRRSRDRGMDDVAAWFLALYKATGIKLTIFYDGYDRGRFLQGFVTTVKLSAYCLILSLALGALVAMLQGARAIAIRRAADAFVQLFRNTPPLVQLYFFYFAVGPVLPKVSSNPVACALLAVASAAPATSAPASHFLCPSRNPTYLLGILIPRSVNLP